MPLPTPRRLTRPVSVGSLVIGGSAPIRVQSMTTTPTQDVAATVAQAIRLAEVGCELVRVTAPGVADARALRDIRAQFSAAGFAHIPLCADIHFMPAAALEAVEHVEKVRINPGNFADKKQFAVREYTDSEWEAEVSRVRERFVPVLRRAKTLGRALRIGVNHGSLSDRMLNRFGDSPEGMVQSALEFCGFCEDEGFQDLVISMKSSNPRVVVMAYRLLAQRLDARGTPYPLHLGVTEAGNGQIARLRSAAGIGALLEDGLGDTIRVSLTEDPVQEIPVARALLKHYRAAPGATNSTHVNALPQSYARRNAQIVRLSGADGGIPCAGGLPPIILGRSDQSGNPDAVLAPMRTVYTQDSDACGPECLHGFALPQEHAAAWLRRALARPRPHSLLAISDPGALSLVEAHRLLARLIEERFHAAEAQQTGSGEREALALILPGTDELHLASQLGALCADGLVDAVYLPDHPDAVDFGFTLLQAARVRLTRTDYVACPSCGRTLFDLETVTAEIQAATGHLDGVTIAVMGCIVNGPGEMADADFGYVGSGPGKITLYLGKEPVLRNIPQETACQHLIQLIKDHGRWREPATKSQG